MLARGKKFSELALSDLALSELALSESALSALSKFQPFSAFQSYRTGVK